jgi:DNA (cytosine-5)-methyltransferase 1
MGKLYVEDSEIIVDLFSAAGGASQGIFMATGRHPDVAVNHNRLAIANHELNHPQTEHFCQDVWSVDPCWVSRGRPVGLLWASPDCTHHSKAKGGPPNRDVRRRDLAFVLTTKWVPALLPRILILENVEEFQNWGPLNKDGVPVKKAQGENFRGFCNALRHYGYAVEWNELVACDYGAPTSRKRLFLIARRDGEPIVWPEPTHGAPDSPEVLSGIRKPWRTAAEIIDWSLPCPSIFATKEEIKEKYGLSAQRPLAETTLRRIAKGLQRYVLDTASPFIVNLNHTKKDGSYDCFRGSSLEDPLWTITTQPGMGLVTPYLAREFGNSVGATCAKPAPTIMATGQGKTALVTPFISKLRGDNFGYGIEEPVQTITAGGQHHALVAPFLMSYYGQKNINDIRGRDMETPMPTQTTENRFSLVSAFLLKYYGADQAPKLESPLHTITTRDRFGLVRVMIMGKPYVIVDIGIRMLSPKELLLATSFPPEYRLDAVVDGKKTSKSAQIAMIGNAVPPVMVKALVSSNFTPLHKKSKNPYSDLHMPIFQSTTGSSHRVYSRLG